MSSSSQNIDIKRTPEDVLLRQALKERDEAREAVAYCTCNRATLSVRSRFEAFVERTDGCWLWRGQRDSRGYGKFACAGRSKNAHRVSHELFKGPVPRLMHVDHLCRNPSCVNPKHLEVVTPKTNTARSDAVTAKNMRKSHCNFGHPFNEANTIIRKDGARLCKACLAKRNAARREQNAMLKEEGITRDQLRALRAELLAARAIYDELLKEHSGDASDNDCALCQKVAAYRRVREKGHT